MNLDQSDPQPLPDENASASQRDVQRPAPLDYGTREPLGRRLLRSRILGWLVVGIVLLACYLLFPAPRSRDLSPVAKCASNLRQIGLACIMYANANSGHWPDDFLQVMTEEDVAPEIFICPVGSDAPAAGPTTQALAANFTTPGHVSYVYLGKGLVEPVATNLIVAYERQQPKGHAGINVLFGDGHVERIDPSNVQAFLKTAQGSTAPLVWTPPK